MSTDIKDIAIPMPIITERLILRAVSPEDSQDLFEAKEESHEELHRWMPWAHERETLEKTRNIMAESAEEFAERKDLMILAFAKDSGRFIAATGLHRMDWDLRVFEIGYWVRTSETGKGYASEVTNALIRYAVKALAATKVKIAHAGGNEASRHIIEKLGFEKEGVLQRERRLPNGTVYDIHWYARFDDKNLPECNVTWG